MSSSCKANHTYYLLPITYYLLPVICYLLPITCHLALLSPHKGDRGTRGQGDKYILSPPPKIRSIYLSIIFFVIQRYVKMDNYRFLCLCTVNLCSPPLNICSSPLNLCLSPVNITFHVEKIHFFPMKNRLSRNYNTML